MFPDRTSTAGAAPGKSRVIKAVGGQLYRASGANSGADCWLQVHDAAALPSNGAIPIHETIAQATFPWDIDLGSIGKYCSNGIVLAASSTPHLLTLIGTDTVTFNATYI